MGFDSDLVLLQPVDTELLCSICTGVYADPVMICNQGHCCCRACIEAWRQQKKETCPLCQGALMPAFLPVRNVANMVAQMQVKCGGGDQDPPNKKRKGAEGDVSAAASDAACDWTGKLEDNGKHQAICAFALVSCRWAGCAVSVRRKELQTHENTLCEHRKLPCKLAGCTELFTAKDLETHEKSCAYRILSCMFAGCDKKMLQSEFLPGPHFSTCGFAPVKCDFPGGGCGATVLRKDMDKHHQEAAGKHLAAVQTQLMEVIKTQGQTIKALENKVTKLEATGATERALRTHSRVIQLEDGATRLTRQITEAKIEAEARCSSLESKIEQSDGDLQEKIDDLETAIGKSEGRIDTLSTFQIIHLLTEEEVADACGEIVEFVATGTFRGSTWSIDLSTAGNGKRQCLWLNILEGVSTILKGAQVMLDGKCVADSKEGIQIGYATAIKKGDALATEATRTWSSNLYQFTAQEEKLLKKAGTKIAVRLIFA